MVFPESRIELVQTYQGRESKNGWLVLRLTGMDLEGTDRFHVNLDIVEKVRRKHAGAPDALKGFWAAPEGEES